MMGQIRSQLERGQLTATAKQDQLGYAFIGGEGKHVATVSAERLYLQQACSISNLGTSSRRGENAVEIISADRRRRSPLFVLGLGT